MLCLGCYEKLAVRVGIGAPSSSLVFPCNRPVTQRLYEFDFAPIESGDGFNKFPPILPSPFGRSVLVDWVVE